jgi:class 3 adenylate cyclase
MRILVFIVGAITWYTAVAGGTDSTEAILRTEGRTTRRVDALLRMGFATYEAPAAENTAYWREAQSISEELQYKVGLAHAPMEAVMTDFHAKHYDSAVAKLKTVIVRLDELGVDQDFYSPLGLLRNVFNASGDQAARFAYFSEALTRYSKGDRPKSLATTHHALAGYYRTIRQYGPAVEHYMKARDLYRSCSPADVPNETMVIGWAYEQWGNPQRAIPFLEASLREYEALGDSSMHAEILAHLAEDELSLGDTLGALRSFDRSRVLWPRTDSLNQALLGSQYTQLLLRMGREREAVAEFERMRSICAARSIPLASHHGVCELDYCRYLLNSANGDPRMADSCLQRALAEAARLNELPLVLKYRKALMHRLLAQGDVRGAAEQSAAYVRLNDSLQAVANTDAVAAYEGQVRERESALEIQRQEARVKQQRMVLMATAVVLLLLATLAWSVYKGKKRSDELLLNILPAEVAKELKATGASVARHIEQATILFTDFKGFTEASELLTPQELVEELDTCFKAFDAIITARGIEKIKTIGDAYMAAGGLPRKVASGVGDVVQAALDMQAFMLKRKAERTALGKPAFDMRLGIHTGPVVAGIVGVKKFQYDIWGDTVNTASRMESSGEVGRVNISESTYREIAVQPGWVFTPRGKVQAKGKGELEMYFVQRN